MRITSTVLCALLSGACISDPDAITRLEAEDEECQSNDDCPAFKECRQNVCLTLCTDLAGCEIDQACSGGVCIEYADVECDASTPCEPGYFCGGAGFCERRANLGAACTMDSQCVSNSCVDNVCCNRLCTGPCQSCNAEVTGGTNGVCSGADIGEDPEDRCGPGATCGPGAQCTTALGTVCSVNAECSSGFCSDGVCCDGACEGECVACTAALTGGTTGECTPIASGADPEDECDPQACDGNGACFVQSNGVACTDDFQCASGFCAPDGVCCNARCAGTCESCATGACTPVTSGPDPGTCASCFPDGTCDGKDVGEGCGDDAECGSGECVDGVCCGGACDGECRTCATGACLPVTDGPDPDTCGTGCFPNGTCDGKALGDTCVNDNECGSGACRDGVCCGSACDGECETCNAAGSCVPVTSGPDGTCAECTPAGVCAAEAGEACLVDSDCLSGTCECGLCREWRVVSSPSSSTLRAAAAASRNEIFAVGDGGVILFFDGSNWSGVSSPTSEDLVDIDESGGVFIAVGDNGTVIRNAAGSGWSMVTPAIGNSGELASVRIVDSGEFWVGAENGAFRLRVNAWESFGVGGGVGGACPSAGFVQDFSTDGSLAFWGLPSCATVLYDPDAGTYSIGDTAPGDGLAGYLRIDGRDLIVAEDGGVAEVSQSAEFGTSYFAIVNRGVFQSGPNAFFLRNGPIAFRDRYDAGSLPFTDLETVVFPQGGVRAIAGANGCAEVAVGDNGLVMRY